MENVETGSKSKAFEIFGSFFLNESEFALSVANVQEVVHSPGKFIELPLAPAYLKGLFNLRGAVIPVIDLRVLLSLPGPSLVESQKVAILEIEGQNVGVLFDRTSEIFRSREEERNDFEEEGRKGVVSGVFKKDDGKRIVQILDARRLLKLDELPKKQGSHLHAQRGMFNQKRGKRKQCISFFVGTSKCAFEIQEIQEILKIERLSDSALAHGYCIGIIDLRGTTVPVIDFSALLGYRETDRSADATGGDRRVVVMRFGKELFGLLVDSIDSIISYFADDLIAFPVLQQNRSEIFLGCLMHNGVSDILLLDHRQVLTHSEITEITRGHSKLYQTNDADLQRSSSKGARKTYITFTVEGTYAVGINDVKEIIDLPEALLHPPGLPSHFMGVLNLRGELVTIVDARAMYSISPRPSGDAGKVLVFKRSGIHFGLVVDAVDAIISFSEGDKVRMPEILYKNGKSGLSEDVTEAVEITASGDQKSNVLILNPDSIASRVTRSAAA